MYCLIRILCCLLSNDLLLLSFSIITFSLTSFCLLVLFFFLFFLCYSLQRGWTQSSLSSVWRVKPVSSPFTITTPRWLSSATRRKFPASSSEPKVRCFFFNIIAVTCSESFCQLVTHHCVQTTLFLSVQFNSKLLFFYLLLSFLLTSQ